MRTPCSPPPASAAPDSQSAWIGVVLLGLGQGGFIDDSGSGGDSAPELFSPGFTGGTLGEGGGTFGLFKGGGFAGTGFNEFGL